MCPREPAGREFGIYRIDHIHMLESRTESFALLHLPCKVCERHVILAVTKK